METEAKYQNIFEKRPNDKEKSQNIIKKRNEPHKIATHCLILILIAYR